MGVPLLLTWLRKRFASCFSPARGDMAGGGPRRADNVYIDLNALLYQSATIIAARKGRFANTHDVEDAVLRKLCELLDDILFNLTAPQALVYIAVDGVSPLGKMAQQRARRRRQSMRRPRPQYSHYNNNNYNNNNNNNNSSQDDYMDEGNMDKLWDGNCISVGTRFMSKVTAALHVYAASRTERINVRRFNEAASNATSSLKSTSRAKADKEGVECRAHDMAARTGDAAQTTANEADKDDTSCCASPTRSSGAFRPVAFIIDDVLRPGEGENKIAEAIRRFHAQPGYNPNTSHIICSSDTDVTVSSLILHEPRMHVLRYEPSPSVGGKPEDTRHDNQHHNHNRRHGSASMDSWQSTFFSIHLFRERLREILGLATKGSTHAMNSGGSTPNTNNVTNANTMNSSSNNNNNATLGGEGTSEDCIRFERSLHDVVFVMLLFGNDFLPALGGSIQEGTLDALLNVVATDFVSRRVSIVDPMTSQIRVENARYLMDCLADIRGIGTGGGVGMHGGARFAGRGGHASEDRNRYSGRGDVLRIHGLPSRAGNSNNNNSNQTRNSGAGVTHDANTDASAAGDWGFDADPHFQARQQQRAKEAEQKCYCYWTMLQWALQYSAGVVEHWGCYYPYTTAPPLALLRRYCGVMSYEGLVRFAAARHATHPLSPDSAWAQGNRPVARESVPVHHPAHDRRPLRTSTAASVTTTTTESGSAETTAVTQSMTSHHADGDHGVARRLGQPTDVMVQLLILMPTESKTLLPPLLQQHYAEIADAVQAPIEQIDFDAIGSWCESLKTRLSVEDRTRFDAYRLFAQDEPLAQAVQHMYHFPPPQPPQPQQHGARDDATHERAHTPSSEATVALSTQTRPDLSRDEHHHHHHHRQHQPHEQVRCPLANYITFMAYWSVDSCEAELAHVQKVRRAEAALLLQKRQQSSLVAQSTNAAAARAISFFTQPANGATAAVANRPASAALAALRTTHPAAAIPLMTRTRTSNERDDSPVSGKTTDTLCNVPDGAADTSSSSAASHAAMCATPESRPDALTASSVSHGDATAEGALDSRRNVETACVAVAADGADGRADARVLWPPVRTLREVCGCYVMHTTPCEALGEEKLIQSMGEVTGAQFTVRHVVGSSASSSSAHASRTGEDYHSSLSTGSASSTSAIGGSRHALWMEQTGGGGDSDGASLWSASLSRDSVTRRVRLHWVLAAVPELTCTRFLDGLLPGVEPNDERSYQETTAAVLEEQARRQQGGGVELRQEVKRVRVG